MLSEKNLSGIRVKIVRVIFGGGVLHKAVSAVALCTSTLTMAQTSLTVPADVQTRTSSFTYFPNGQIKTETVEPDDTTNKLKLTTTYAYDANGNRISTNVTGWNGTATISRVSTASYAANGVNQAGLYATSVTSGTGADQLLETREYHPLWGGITKLIGPNGVMTKWEYDEFGRKTFERRGYASSAATSYTDYTQWSYTQCGCSAVSATVGGTTTTVTPVYYATVQVFSGEATPVKLAPISKVYYDSLNREIRTETEGIKAGVVKAIYKDTVYDARGRVRAVSLPYFSGDTPQWTQTAYDDLNRKTAETLPSGLVTNYSYSSLQSSMVVHAAAADGGDRTRTEVRNVLDKTVAVLDELGQWTFFINDAKGNLTHTVDQAGNVTKLTYDLRGRKTAMADPDMGNWSYAYNAFGELTRQQDALGQITNLTYDDVFGRLKTRAETGSSADKNLTSTFLYGTVAPEKGKLKQASTDNGYCRIHSYDSLGRPQSTVVRIGGATPCTTGTDANLTTTVNYDAAGRVDKLTYPTGVVLKQHYNATLGFLDQIYNNTGGVTGTAYWTWQGNDALGRITSYVYGNNVATGKTYDPVKGGLTSLKAGKGGNAAMADVQNSSYVYDSVNRLSQRADRFDTINMVERTIYDNLNRLKQYGLYDSNGVNPTGTPTTLTYDALGNILTKSDVGTYTYPASGASSVRPHAVSTTAGTANNSYAYDANGNMLSGAGRTLTYTSFNMVNQVGNASACHKFAYQGEHQRYQQLIYSVPCASVTGTTTATSKTFYLHPDAANGLSFEQEIKGGATTYKHFINAGGQVVAVLTTSSLAGNTATSGAVNYLHYDHLGSVVAVTNTASPVAVVERRSFDPWGRPRNTSGTAGTGELPNGINAATDRGFTMHEHLENVGLIHMNGRVYDPTLARFSSADPFVQTPTNSQSYNRYSYGWNSPLMGSDPSGYNWLSDRWHSVMRSTVGRVVVIAAVAWATAGAATWAMSAYAAPAAAAESGIFALTTVVTESSLATYGAAYTAAMAYAPVVAGAAGGLAGGLMGSNGQIKEGLKGAVTGAAFGYVGSQYTAGTTGSYVGHAVVGCGSAMMSGGNCGRGAVSALAGKATTNSVEGLDDLSKGIATTIAGGVSSKLTGGSFENGARTAAFGYLFNYCSKGVCSTAFEQFMYDWWPGYKAGTLLYNQTMGDGSWTGWEVLDAASVGMGAMGKGLSLGLSGGSRSVFWSGWGAKAEAMNYGMTLESTPIGRVLDFAQGRGWMGNGAFSNFVWNQASATYAGNATGVAQTVIRFNTPNSVFYKVELPILQRNGVILQSR